MTHEILAFACYYLCAFVGHLYLHIKHKPHLPDWAHKSRAHKFAAVTAMVGAGASFEGLQGFGIHLLVYSGLFL